MEQAKTLVFNDEELEMFRQKSYDEEIATFDEELAIAQVREIIDHYKKTGIIPEFPFATDEERSKYYAAIFKTPLWDLF